MFAGDLRTGAALAIHDAGAERVLLQYFVMRQEILKVVLSW
jgi:hypothetical protein